MSSLPAPVFNSPKTHKRPAVAPPLPPSVGLSIFDNQFGDTVDVANLSRPDESEVQLHPDDVLKGENLRVPSLLESGERSNSFYLVHSARSKLVKIGITLYTYEECKAKFTKLYARLDAFRLFKVENGKHIVCHHTNISDSNQCLVLHRHDSRAPGASLLPVLL